MSIKKILPVLSVICCVLFLCACASGGTIHTSSRDDDEEETVESPEDTPSPVPTNTSTPTPSPAPVVTVEEASREYAESDGEVYVIRIPKVTITGVDTTVINDHLASELSYDLSEEGYYDDEYGEYVPNLVPIDYEYYQYGDILSIFVMMRDLDRWAEDYRIFNISVHDGRLLTNDEFFDSAGITESQYYELVSDTYITWWSDPDTWVNEYEDHSFMGEYQVQECMSCDTFTPFINSDGHICFAVIVPIPEGEDEYVDKFDTVLKNNF